MIAGEATARGKNRWPAGSITAAASSSRVSNVMLGYLKAEAPGVLQPPDGGWYDTGDIIEIDREEFVTSKGAPPVRRPRAG